MRWVSLEAVRVAAGDALRRFPLPLLCAWTAAALTDWQILDQHTFHRQMLAATMAAALGISLYFAIALYRERDAGPSLVRRPILELLALAALVAIALLSPRWSEPIATRRYLQLGLFSHALVAFLPYLAVREPRGFWHYNRTLLIRLIVASIFTGVLVAGLDGAIAGGSFIFNLRISPKTYFIVASLCGLVFHPWFFLAGIPRDLGALEHRTDYPGDIKIFAQFILVPLVAIYQVLLTAYLVKIIATRQWPSGVIGILVSAEAIFGILAILLIHPVRERAENLWVRTFSRGFYIALLPSIGMMAMSIAKRVGQYGVTEDRYFAIVLTAWLALISVYFMGRCDGDIRVIPITLAALALVTLGGPWGAYTISRASQTHRLERLLERAGLLVHGAVRPAAAEPPPDVERNISSILDYLSSTHGLETIQKQFGEYAMVADHGPRRPEPDMSRVMKRLGMRHLASGETFNRREITYNHNWTTGLEAQALGAYAFHVHIDRAPPIVLRVNDTAVNLRIDSPSRRLILFQGADSLAVFDFAAALDSAARQYSSPDTSGHGIRLESIGGGSPALITITQLYANQDRDIIVFALNADLYFSLRPR